MEVLSNLIIVGIDFSYQLPVPLANFSIAVIRRLLPSRGSSIVKWSSEEQCSLWISITDRGKWDSVSPKKKKKTIETLKSSVVKPNSATKTCPPKVESIRFRTLGSPPNPKLLPVSLKLPQRAGYCPEKVHTILLNTHFLFELASNGKPQGPYYNVHADDRANPAEERVIHSHFA